MSQVTECWEDRRLQAHQQFETTVHHEVFAKRYRVVEHTAGAGPQLPQYCSLFTCMLQRKGPDIMCLHQIMTPICTPCKAWQASLSSPTAPRSNHGPCLNKVMCLRLRQNNSLLPCMLQGRQSYHVDRNRGLLCKPVC